MHRQTRSKYASRPMGGQLLDGRASALVNFLFGAEESKAGQCMHAVVSYDFLAILDSFDGHCKL